MFLIRKKSFTGYLIIVFMVSLFSVIILLQLGQSDNRSLIYNPKAKSIQDVNEFHNKSANFIFIGGFARSGTTLMVSLVILN